MLMLLSHTVATAESPKDSEEKQYSVFISLSKTKSNGRLLDLQSQPSVTSKIKT